ncbi:tyrosine-type recombinase/integrase [Oscillatoria sp. CS-180]|uniref:tyrosine-type recombinase/integrase n=1 Tax=Oscillatoria sp. CS-180 TaxID=3021720 RepID=UPI00232D0A8E|nr:tyrosine-type recombinase/integrase [Oscillatoria sp. CS-180]MDB9526985.1 tyrosine-type recombinase/integrase [Oscillatoria sp. CS-180]
MPNVHKSIVAVSNAMPVGGGLDGIVPAIVYNSGEETAHRFVEYFIGQIRNPNTRQAYGHAVKLFLSWCEAKGAQRLEDITYIAVASYIEQHPGNPQTVNQHLTAIRRLFAWLVKQKLLAMNPAENIVGRKYRTKIGKTPELETVEMRQLVDSFDVSHIIGLRDRALICLMGFSFARIGAVLAMNVEDYFLKGASHWIRLHEKGGKYLELPLHHTANEYLHGYVETATSQEGITWGKGTPLFRSQQRGRVRKLSDRRLDRRDSWAMVKRRCKAAGINTDACNHTFRATGITNFLENGGALEIAQEIAAHADSRTTALYDRRREKVSLDEIERIRF